MTMESKKYSALNKLASQNGIVLFGGTSDLDIPIGELRQAFAIEQSIYNRSFSNLSIDDAVTLYDTYISPLVPETLLIHIGEVDLLNFAHNPSAFIQKYCELLAHIKGLNKKCRIAVISLSNPENHAQITGFNTQLKHIAQSEHCEYGDIAVKKVWNPKNTKDTMSFLYSTGFVRPLKNKRPLFDLIKILYCYM